MKIEGRLKPAEYVASVTRHYRTAHRRRLWCRRPACRGSFRCRRDAAPQTRSRSHRRNGNHLFPRFLPRLARRARPSLAGLRRARPSAASFWAVRGVRGERILVELAGPLRRGDGVVFEGDRSQGRRTRRPRLRNISRSAAPSRPKSPRGWSSWLSAMARSIRAAIRLGQKVWKTDDPRAARRLRQTYSSATRSAACRSIWWWKPGRQPLRVVATTATGTACRLESPRAVARGDETPADRRNAQRAIRPARQNALRVAPARSEARRPGDDPLERARQAAPRNDPPVGRCRERAAARAVLEGSALAALRTSGEAEWEMGEWGEWEQEQDSQHSVSNLHISTSPSLPSLPPSTSSAVRWTNSRRRSIAAHRA